MNPDNTSGNTNDDINSTNDGGKQTYRVRGKAFANIEPCRGMREDATDG